MTGEDNTQLQGPWETPIIRDEDDNIVGATFFLDREVLSDLYSDIEEKSELYYQVTDEGDIQISDPD